MNYKRFKTWCKERGLLIPSEETFNQISLRWKALAKDSARRAKEREIVGN